MSAVPEEFYLAYARHRADEGHSLRGDELRALPYVRSGALARHWAVRAATFETFLRHIARPLARSGSKTILDLGAGNGWLSHRLARMNHRTVALDVRDDDIDGLGAAKGFLLESPCLFSRVRASFDDLPFDRGQFDVVVFNASLHYAQNLGRVMSEAIRVTRSGGTIAIMDSPFYASERDGNAMVAEKNASGSAKFGERAQVLLAQSFIEFLTRKRLRAASGKLSWVRHRVRYPLWYELRPAIAWLKGRRTPSRFDLWVARVP